MFQVCGNKTMKRCYVFVWSRSGIIMAFQRFVKSHYFVCREFHSPFYPDASYHHKTMINLTTHQLLTIPVHDSVAVSRGRSLKKVFFENSLNSQENTCARVSFLIKLQAETGTPPVAAFHDCTYVNCVSDTLTLSVN